MTIEQTVTITEIMATENILSISDGDENHIILDLDDVRTVEILADGEQRWYQHGKFHRNNGPAVIWADGSQYWYQNDKFHRDDGPAVIARGEQHWYQNDKELTRAQFDAQQNAC